MGSLGSFGGRGKGVEGGAAASRGAWDGGAAEERSMAEEKSSGSSSMRDMVDGCCGEAVVVARWFMCESKLSNSGLSRR